MPLKGIKKNRRFFAGFRMTMSSFQKTLKEEILYFLLDDKNHHSPFCSDREKSYPLCLYAVILSVSEESQPYKSFEK